MKTPEEFLTRGKGYFINCTDYDDAIQAMKDYAQQFQPVKEEQNFDFKTCRALGLLEGVVSGLNNEDADHKGCQKVLNEVIRILEQRPIQPVTEVKSDAIEFADWVLNHGYLHVDRHNMSIHRTELGAKRITALELYQLFTSQSIHQETKTDKP